VCSAIGAVSLAAAIALVAVHQVPAGAVPIEETYANLLVKKVSGPNVQKHMVALQAIADANGGTRAAGTAGYDASRDYVAGKLRAAGFSVTLDPINLVEAWVENSPPVLDQLSPTAKSYASNSEFFTFRPSPAGDVTALVQAVDLTLPPTPAPSSTSGCETSDLAGFVPGRIALTRAP
jgi:hypothetical protein